ncbi:MAG: hypothetical protein ACYS8W_21655 [Planctomycetota bacterium]|jgi:hypothetical protein
MDHPNLLDGTVCVEVLTPKEVFRFFALEKKEAAAGGSGNGSEIPAWEYIGITKEFLTVQDYCVKIIVPKIFVATETPAPDIELPAKVVTDPVLVIRPDGECERM